MSFVEVLSGLTTEDEWESMYKSTESVPVSDWRILRMTAGESKYNMAVQRFGDDRVVLVSAVDLIDAMMQDAAIEIEFAK